MLRSPRAGSIEPLKRAVNRPQEGGYGLRVLREMAARQDGVAETVIDALNPPQFHAIST